MECKCSVKISKEVEAKMTLTKEDVEELIIKFALTQPEFHGFSEGDITVDEEEDKSYTVGAWREEKKE